MSPPRPPTDGATAGLGRRIRRLRKERKISRGDLAARVGLQRIDLVRIEKGERDVDLDTLVKILELFQGAELVGDSPTPYRTPPMRRMALPLQPLWH